MKVFISSTYIDLEEYHQAAAKAVRGLAHQVVSMEDFPSGEEMPVDKSLSDVHDCEVYIGILAFRYGEIHLTLLKQSASYRLQRTVRALFSEKNLFALRLLDLSVKATNSSMKAKCW